MKTLILLAIIAVYAFSQDTIFIGKGNECIFYVKDTIKYPKHIKRIDSISDSSNCIFFRHSYEKDNNGNLVTILNIQSYLTNTIKFNTYLFGFKKKKWIYTNSCPLSYKIGSYESWPFKADSIMITNIRYISKDSTACK